MNTSYTFAFFFSLALVSLFLSFRFCLILSVPPFCHLLYPLSPPTEPFIHTITNSELIPFTSFTWLFFYVLIQFLACFPPIARLLAIVRLFTKSRIEYQEDYNMREEKREESQFNVIEKFFECNFYYRLNNSTYLSICFFYID